jgi:flagellar basal-body rod modification protein FlgD
MTMAINPIGASQGATTGSENQLAALNSNEFLQLLVTELTNQDPLSPMNPAAMVQQTSTISMVQMLDTLTTELASLTTQEGVLGAAALVGQQVSWRQPSGATGSGVVSSVQLGSGGLSLVVGGQAVPASEVTAVGGAS